MRCLDAESIGRLAIGEDLGRDAERHVVSCTSCSHCVHATREALRIRVNAEMVEDQNSLALELLAVSAERRSQLAAHDRYAHAGIARRFNAMAMEEWSVDLNAALHHAHVATVISSRLERRYGGAAEVYFEAWKTRSTVHRNRGEYDAARAALKFAEAVVPRCSDVELKRAIIAFADACICTYPDVWEPQQALAGLDVSEPVFARRQDNPRVVSSLSLRGKVHLRCGEYVEALNFYSAALEGTGEGDDAGRAFALANVANALIRVGRFDDAEAALNDARRIGERLGRTLELVRYDALRAFALDERGLREEAADLYGDVARRFAEAGDSAAAMIAAKDRAVALVAVGRVSDARAALSQLLRQAINAGDDRRRFTAEALAYLRDLAAREQLTPEVADDVSAYIDRIHAQRVTPFIPPVSLHTM